MSKLNERISNFLEDYNALLEGFNDEMGGIEDISTYKKCTKFKNVNVIDIENDEILFDEYTEIKNLLNT